MGDMTVHIAMAREWSGHGKSDSVVGAFLTQAEAVAAIERRKGVAVTLIRNGFVWCVDEAGIEVGYCVETTVGA